MHRTKFVAGNWKMNTTKASAIELAKAVAAGAPAGVQTGIAPPFVYLDAVSQAIKGSSVELGAQDVYFEKNGAFTGNLNGDAIIFRRVCLGWRRGRQVDRNRQDAIE